MRGGSKIVRTSVIQKDVGKWRNGVMDGRVNRLRPDV